MKLISLYLAILCLTMFACESDDSPCNCDCNTSPLAKFEYSVYDCTPGAKCIQFQNVSDSTNSGTSYLWTFGDGTESTQENPSHSYQRLSEYNIVLKVINCDNKISYYSETIDLWEY